MKAVFRSQKHAAIIYLSLVLAGCLGGRSAPTRFYMLSPLVQSQTRTSPVTAEARFHIGLEMVVVAEYLNRNEIVVNLDNTIYQLAEFNQWMEPLNNNLTRVLEENLTNLLQADSIDIFLVSGSSIPLDYRLEVDVLRLDGNLGDQATLVAQWALLDEEDELRIMRRTKYQEQTIDSTYKELVLAKSRTIERLSRDISAGVKKILAEKTGE
jgi:uncharacterized lipoprotein YmbA